MSEILKEREPQAPLAKQHHPRNVTEIADADRFEPAALAAEFRVLDLYERVAILRGRIPGRIVFTTSFGLEDQAIAHAIFSQTLAIDVVTFDTGRLFPETHDVWAATEARYQTRIYGLAPDRADLEALIAKQGINGFRASVDARHDCCATRKVAPLARALKNTAVWITGIRADQSGDRADVTPVAFDAAHELIKANPLFDWTRQQTRTFVHANDVPYNILHDRNFLSIGCAPCTRAVKPGEPERAGRWWWERTEKKECGLHLTGDGRLARTNSSSA
jgi:phosphoadenosine phosphosulfate reductase